MVSNIPPDGSVGKTFLSDELFIRIFILYCLRFLDADFFLVKQKIRYIIQKFSKEFMVKI